jgi:hypothetical protein
MRYHTKRVRCCMRSVAMCVQEALSAHQAESSDVAAERAALRSDLDKLLRERGTLDSLKRVVAAAMKTQVGTLGAKRSQGSEGS